MNSCIFIASYPNTPRKIEILKECILSFGTINLPVVLISNMDLPEEISHLVEDCVIGKNEECRYQDFFSNEEIDFARNTSQYFSYFTPTGDDIIYFNPFSYGRGSTYHWSALTQYLKIIEYSEKKNISHALIVDGDVIISEGDVKKTEDFFSSLEKDNLDFIVSMQHNLRHPSGNICFTSVDYWKKVCSNFSAEDFLRSTYPNWAAEKYIFNKMILAGGRGKILFWEDPSLSILEFYPRWILSEFKIPQGIESPQSVNLFFPETEKISLSSNTDRPDQDPRDPLTYVQMGTGEKSGLPVFFIRNTYSGEIVKEVKTKITIFDGESVIFESSCNLSSGGWAWSPIFNLKGDSSCTVEIVVVDIRGEEFFFLDKFGSVGASINMKEVISE